MDNLTEEAVFDSSKNTFVLTKIVGAGSEELVPLNSYYDQHELSITVNSITSDNPSEGRFTFQDVWTSDSAGDWRRTILLKNSSSGTLRITLEVEAIR